MTTFATKVCLFLAMITSFISARISDVPELFLAGVGFNLALIVVSAYEIVRDARS